MKKLAALILAGLLMGILPAGAATILPPGKTCFDDANGKALGGGSVGFYIPSTLTFKDTWQDAGQTILNLNPVPLNSGGCAVIYGSGTYRQIVKDLLGNTIWDQPTAEAGITSVGFAPPTGRLTLSSGHPSPIDVASATTVFYTPYYGNVIQIWNGATLVTYAYPELVQALDPNSADQGYHQVGKTFDEFVIVDPNVNPRILRLCTGPAWTSDSDRGTGASTTELYRTTTGVIANANSIVCRYGPTSGEKITVARDFATYVGTMRTISNGHTAMILNPPPASGGTPAYIGLWNCYNRVLVKAIVVDNGGAYDYSTDAVRFARQGTNAIAFVSGLATDAYIVSYYDRVHMKPTAGGGWGSYGIGLDSTNIYSGIFAFVVWISPNGADNASTITYSLSPQIGSHQVYALEHADGTHPATFSDFATPAVLQIAAFM
jgi:hypothetical protein